MNDEDKKKLLLIVQGTLGSAIGLDKSVELSEALEKFIGMLQYRSYRNGQRHAEEAARCKQ